jgi:fructose-1,6-bisphosphatase/inositol monophosphatase family enzyme
MQQIKKKAPSSKTEKISLAGHGHDLHHLGRMLATAENAARKAGAVHMQRFGNDPPEVLENRAHDLKIQTDRESEAVICDILHNQFPEHAILSEESDFEGHGAEYTWIIDPLDGTVNYFFDLPFFCTCIACYYTATPTPIDHCSPDAYMLAQGVPLVGVVYAPSFDWMYCAASGRGATWNGVPIQNRQKGRLEDAIIGVSFGSRPDVIDEMKVLAPVLANRAKKIRMFGSTGLDLVQVAKGTISGLVQLNVNIWDFAAAQLILSESGVKFDASFNRMGGWCIVAAPPSQFLQLQELVENCLSNDFLAG